MICSSLTSAVLTNSKMVKRMYIIILDFYLQRIMWQFLRTILVRRFYQMVTQTTQMAIYMENYHFINEINLYFTNSVMNYTVKLYFKNNMWGLCILSQIKLAGGKWWVLYQACSIIMEGGGGGIKLLFNAVRFVYWPVNFLHPSKKWGGW